MAGSSILFLGVVITYIHMALEDICCVGGGVVFSF